jgi:hypothetical protein
MTHTRHTLELDSNWDLCLTETGNIKVTIGVLATAQAVANEARLFTSDAYFRYAQGIPHYLTALGSKIPAKALLRSYLRQAVSRVADVRELFGIELEDFDKVSRRLHGNLFFATHGGENVNLGI